MERPRLSGCGQPQIESAPGAGLRLAKDAAAVGLDNGFCNGQSQAGSPVLVRGHKRLEQVVLDVVRDAGTIVPHTNLDLMFQTPP